MGAHVLLPLAVNIKSEGKVDSLPLLGLEPGTYGTQAHLSDRSAKSHPQMYQHFSFFKMLGSTKNITKQKHWLQNFTLDRTFSNP
jgi:hypothetical protein